MHSYDHMLKEVEEKLAKVQKALCICESERSNLNSNLASIKQAVDESFKRHIGTLQCRAKWLVCHADSIYHLKEGSLSQQIAELELISNELKSCLDSSQYPFNKNEELELLVKNVLESSSQMSLQPCENGSMDFIANNNKLEEMIIGFGDIDAHEHSMVDCDSLSDEGIFVVESPVRKPDSIEMKVKSMEMYHLTTQSANDEKEDFERIEMDMHDGSIDFDNSVVSQRGQRDSGVEEGTESGDDSIEWLHRANTGDQVVPEKSLIDFQLCDDDIRSEDICNHVTNTTNKVPLWLKKCEEPPNMWIRDTSRKDTSPSSMDLFGNFNIPGNSIFTSLELNIKNEHTNIDNMNSIFLASSSKFLRSNMEGLDCSVHSLESDLSSLAIGENKTEVKNRKNESSAKQINIDHFDSILKEDNSIFLRRNANSNSTPLNPLQSLDIDEDSSVSFLRDEVSPSMEDASSNDKSNLSCIDGILDAQANEFLIARDRNDQALRNPFTSSSAVNHMQKLLSKPDRMFLRSGIKVKTFDPALCEWLRGSSTVDNCMQCFDYNECEISGRLGSKWVKTASDW